MVFKSGFVNIVGNPNVGKSTLMNELVGERLSIVTSKSQTTRHRILGIVNGEDHQIVFSDTPGVLKPAYKLQESMLKFSESALVDADIILYITDTEETAEKNSDFLAKIQKMGETTPILLVINKIDLIDQERLVKLVAFWENLLPKAEIIPSSALNKFNVDYIMKRIIALLPEGEPYYDQDALTDKPMRFFVSEIIREKILKLYSKEIPYSCEVVVEQYEESAKNVHIRAVINVARDSQKGIIIGKKGEGIKRLGMESRKDIETFIGKGIYLDLYVKVEKDWRNNEKNLKEFGYIQQDDDDKK